jgi:hypothetical protein
MSEHVQQSSIDLTPFVGKLVGIRPLAKSPCVSVPTLRRLTREGRFPPATIVGRKWMYCLEQVQAHLERQRQGGPARAS